jgi:hypothetical protein
MVRSRVCAEPGCPTLVEGGRCGVHDTSRDPRSSRNHRGVSRQARGLGADHVRARREVIGGPCVLRLEGCTGVATTLEHRRPRSQGGTLADGYGGACAHCQAVQGGRLARAG